MMSRHALNLLQAGDNKLSWLAPIGRRADPDTTRKYAQSQLCLTPAGDTPTSRRLYDAMAGGCVAIVMAPLNDIFPNMPFPASID